MYLAQNIFLAVVGDRGVVLDLQRDRYLGLGASTTRELVGHLGPDAPPDERLDVAPGSPLGRLIAQGVLTARRTGRSATFGALPTSTLWPSHEGRPPRLSARAQAAVLRALFEAQFSLAHRPFHRTVQWLRAEKARSARRGVAMGAQGVVDQFFEMRPWFPVRPICRLDAMALCLHAWRSGQAASLVFGVRLDPFAAHCWAQLDAAALKEAHEELRQYTPIMAI